MTEQTKTNTKVLCPVDDCKKGFDNRGRFVNHMKSEHDPKDIVETGEPERIGGEGLPSREKIDEEKKQVIDCDNCDYKETFDNIEEAKSGWDKHQSKTNHFPEIEQV